LTAPDPTLLPLLTRALTSDTSTVAVDSVTDERILDAALDLVAAYGARRTSMDEIAERAGVARATVFRRFGGKRQVIDRLFSRELERFLDSVRDTIRAAPDVETSVVDTFAAVVRYGASHPLIDRLVRIEPQVLVETLRTGDPSPLELGRAFVADRLRAGQRRGAIPARDADQLADILVRLAVSYLLIPSGAFEIGDERSLRAFARGAIAPIVTSQR
jgi:AcrR family transcriptional regulator